MDRYDSFEIIGAIRGRFAVIEIQVDGSQKWLGQYHTRGEAQEKINTLMSAQLDKRDK